MVNDDNIKRLALTEEEEKELREKLEKEFEKREIKSEKEGEEVSITVPGPRGGPAPLLSESGGYCSYESKEWEVELDDDYNVINVTVEGTKLNVEY